jgi:tetraacyldisaccharide 4'-kinase
MISALRSWLYREGMLRTTDLPAFVLSVGNISMGGTGKSPLAILLAEWGVKNGFRTAVLSRGYKRKTKELMIVGPGEALPSAAELGDEPWMIKNRVPGISLLVHHDRGRMAKRHWQELGSPELVILDDGFQHWRLARDRDLVLVDAKEGLDRSPIPLGPFREPATALKRADMVLITQAGTVAENTLQSIEQRVRNFLEDRKLSHWKRSHAANPVVLQADYELADFSDFQGRTQAAPASRKEFLLVSGIAKPDRFRDLAKKSGLSVREEIYFPDHHVLTRKNREHILSALEKLRDGALLLSEKDWARWHEQFSGMDGIVLRVKFRFPGESARRLDHFLAELQGEVRRCSISG